MKDIHSILKTYWGYELFRPLQEEIIHSVLNGQDTLALLPTGGGKSVCFQVPALAQPGICLVISPLIALMKDQVENLRQKGIMALSIYSGMSRRQIVQTLKNASYGDYKILYVSPERLETDLFKEYLPALGVNLIAVDEAHCISQWGYDFRPSYLKIAELRNELPGVPVLALTASATPEVQKDICEKLSFSRINIFRQSYERSNLSYSVFKLDAKVAKLVDIISKVAGSAIIYCKSRKRTVELSNLLTMHGLSAQFYHAGVEKQLRDLKQSDWVENKIKIMVCTNAFGMGIDKPDVRLVVHADVPDSLENYYQEAGRAGRDGKKSYAVLLYDERDRGQLEELHTIRYPSLEKIKQVYGALISFLQIPVYTGEGISYNFHFEEFIRNFKLKGTEALYALKALESDEWIYFNERNFSPSTVVFTTSKQQLNDFQKMNPQSASLLTTMLRNYDGIFDYPSYISETLLAQQLKKDEKEIISLLKQAAAYRIIDYRPQNDEPQIVFRKHRVAVEDLTINLSLYAKRKEAFMARIEKMIAYANTKTCRSRFINEYFAESTDTCGICDNCLREKTLQIKTEEFKKINTFIIEHLTRESLTAQQLLHLLKGIKKEKAWRVVQFLQAEKKIGVDAKGCLYLIAS